MENVIHIMKMDNYLLFVIMLMIKKMENIKKYYENGQLSFICKYVNEKENGESKIYSEDNISTSHKIYENGVIIQIFL